MLARAFFDGYTRGFSMFNRKIKNQLNSQAVELSELRQLRDGLSRGMLTLCFDSTFKIIECDQTLQRLWVILRISW